MAETAIAWGEADVRDCMRDFDPGATDLFGAWPGPGRGAVGVRGRRGTVTVYAFWTGKDWGGVFSGPPHARRCVDFEDPIEAIQHAIALAREEQV